MASVTIEIPNPRTIERAVYWIIIIVLGVLLVLSYLDNGASDTTQTANEDVDPNENVDVTPPPSAPVDTTPEETCSDGVLNQDETDVDCGGSCTGCAAGDSCESASDCRADYCVAGKCSSDDPGQLSGKLEIKVTDVEYQTSAIGTAKVLGVDYTIDNGLEDDEDRYLVKVFVKNKAGTKCLNQETGGTCDNTYAEFFVPGVQSGKSTSDGHDIQDSEYTSPKGRYIIGGADGYDPANGDDDFTVFMYLYDQDGNQIGGKTISSFKTVSP